MPRVPGADPQHIHFGGWMTDSVVLFLPPRFCEADTGLPFPATWTLFTHRTKWMVCTGAGERMTRSTLLGALGRGSISCKSLELLLS